jgi:hypothetical protein
MDKVPPKVDVVLPNRFFVRFFGGQVEAGEVDNDQESKGHLIKWYHDSPTVGQANDGSSAEEWTLVEGNTSRCSRVRSRMLSLSKGQTGVWKTA